MRENRINYEDLNTITNKKTTLLVNNHEMYKELVLSKPNDISNIKDQTIIDFLVEELNKKHAQEGKISRVHVISADICAILIYKILISIQNQNENENDSVKDMWSIPSSAVDYEIAKNLYNELVIIKGSLQKKAYNQEQKIEGEKNEEEATLRKIAFFEKIYTKFSEMLEEYDLYDEIRLLNELGDFVNVENLYIEEHLFNELSYLEKKTLKIDDNFKNIVTFIPDKTSKNVSLFKVYGTVQEVQNVINLINNSEDSYGDIEVIYANKRYEPYLKAMFEKAKIPFVLSNSSLSDNKVYTILSIIFEWIKNEYDFACFVKLEKFFPNLKNGFALLKSLNFTYTLKQYEDFVQGMNKNRKAYLNMYEEDLGVRFYPSVDVICDDIDGYYTNFVKFINIIIEIAKGNNLNLLYKAYLKFLTDNANEELSNIINMLQNDIDYYQYFDLSLDKNEMFELILNRIASLNITNKKEFNKISISMFSDFTIYARKNLFFIGFSFEDFTINSGDSALFSDEEKCIYLEVNKCGFVPLSYLKNALKDEKLNDTLQACHNVNITMSYSFMNILEQSKQSPCLVYNNLYNNSEKKQIVVSKYDGIIEESHRFDYLTCKVNDDVKPLFNLGFKEESNNDHKLYVFSVSASQLDKITTCYLRYQYESQNFQTLAKHDAKTWLQSNTMGSFMHKVLELYAKDELLGKINISTNINDTTFETIFNKLLSSYEKAYPCKITRIKEQQVLKMKKHLFDTITKLHKDLNETGFVVGGCEKKERNIICASLNKDGEPFNPLVDDCEYQLRVTCEYDRFDYKIIGDKKVCRIIDYKTGKKKNCDSVQYYVYPLMNEFNSYTDITFTYDFICDDTKEEYHNTKDQCKSYLSNILKSILLKQFNFGNPKDENSKACKYCNLAEYCIRKWEGINNE